MTELKVKGVDDVYIEYFNTGNHDLAKVYLKTEVDHYIAELEEKHKKEVEQLLILNREQNNNHLRYEDSMKTVIQDQKYKLCVIPAEYTMKKVRGSKNVKQRFQAMKRRYKWLELAHKFIRTTIQQRQRQ